VPAGGVGVELEHPARREHRTGNNAVRRFRWFPNVDQQNVALVDLGRGFGRVRFSIPAFAAVIISLR
jgi:hypothetical protein